MNASLRTVAQLVALVIACTTGSSVYAGSKARMVSQALARKMLMRDFERDALTPAKALPAARTVQRYTSARQAAREARLGLSPGTHMTPGLRLGRPLSDAGAARRYGLPRNPTVRETIALPKGTPIRANKALAGKRGVGELTSSNDIPPGAIVRIDKLRHSKRALRSNTPTRQYAHSSRNEMIAQ